MAEGIVSFVLNKLSDAVVKEVLLIHGVGEKVEELSREFSRIHAFLKDADMKHILNERQKHWVEEVRDVAYDIEDIIDNAFFLKVSENPSKNVLRGGWSRIVEGAKRTWSKPKKLPAFHNLADEMNRIQARIQEINESRERYGINFLGERIGERPRLPVRPPMLPDIDDPYVVGFDPDRDKIVEQLLDKSSKRRVVISIVGPGGLGKTTLARKVYNSNDVKRQFDIRIWVTISQEFNLMDILRKIIEHIEPLPQSDIEKGGEEYLLTKLYKTLNGENYTIKEYLHPKSHKPFSYERDPQASEKPKPRPKKYLLVLDDIWTSDIWTRIGVVLPHDESGSRVIITTRFLNVADNAKPYNLSYLSEELSLELLLKKALPNQDLSKGYPDDLYEVGKQFVKRCGGLPLALVVLEGLLSKRPTNYAAWSKLLQTMNWGTDGRECTEILATSYNDLPFVLKSCFMYFAVFPEDHEIDAQKLFQLWVAEGLIPTEEFRTLEDTAESLLEDLVQRSLVQVSKRSHTSSITHCRIHDLLRELAIHKAKEENFLTVCSKPDNWKSGTKARRVAVHYSGCSELMEHANPNLRSLLCFEPPMPNCSQQRLLKVLSDMGRNRGIEFKCFNGLTQLRYCELRGRWNNERRIFRSFIGGLKFVETLDLHLEDHGDLPDDIWNVKTLRHVKLNPYSPGPSSSADLRNLQTLTGVRSMESWYAQLPKLPNVRDLDIKLANNCSWDTIAPLFGTMNHLTHLSLFKCKLPVVHMEGLPIYQQLRCLSLKEDKYKINKCKLPLEVGMFPIHVMELTLENLQFQNDPLPLLGKLSSLRMLRLMGEEANQKMSCSAGGFKQLHQLEFVGLNILEEWEINEGAMPVLKQVTLNDCNRLRVPLGFQYLSDLKELKVSMCQILQKAEEANEIRNMCKQVPSISIRDFLF